MIGDYIDDVGAGRAPSPEEIERCNDNMRRARAAEVSGAVASRKVEIHEIPYTGTEKRAEVVEIPVSNFVTLP